MTYSSPDVYKYRGEKPAIETMLHLSRFRLGNVGAKGTSSRASQAELISAIPSSNAGDLPINNSRYLTHKHRYIYNLVDRGCSSFLDFIGKTDTETKTAIWWMEDKCTPGDPIFVANLDGVEQDDGVLLNAGLDGRPGLAFSYAWMQEN